MANKKGFGKPITGENVAGYGAKKGRSGLDPRFNTEIKPDIFSKAWASPLNSGNPDDPLIDPNEGAALSEGIEGVGLPPNPMGIENLDHTTVTPGGTSAVGKYRSGRGR